MTSFDPAKHPRQGDGQFTERGLTDPGVGVLDDGLDTILPPKAAAAVRRLDAIGNQVNDNPDARLYTLDGQPAAPNSCAWCAVEQRDHGNRYTRPHGAHTWLAPSDELRLARIRAGATLV